MIINQQLFILEGIKSILQTQTEIELVATGEIKDLIILVETNQPNTLLLDLQTTNFYYLSIIKEAQEKYPNTNFIVMSDSFSIQQIKELTSSGVIGFIQQYTSSEELIKAITFVGQGKLYIPEYVMELIFPAFHQLIQSYGSSSFVQLDVRKPFHLFTARECITLQLLAEGHSNKSIAESMGISDKTVKNHVSTILLKMGVRDRTQAVLKALKNGWVHLN